MTAYTIIHHHRFGTSVHRIISPDENLNQTLNDQEDYEVAVGALMEHMDVDYEPDLDETIDILTEGMIETITVPSIAELLK
jgi:hypothetical protein